MHRDGGECRLTDPGRWSEGQAVVVAALPDRAAPAEWRHADLPGDGYRDPRTRDSPTAGDHRRHLRAAHRPVDGAGRARHRAGLLYDPGDGEGLWPDR